MAEITVSGIKKTGVTIRDRTEAYVEFVDSEGFTQTVSWDDISNIKQSPMERLPKYEMEPIKNAIDTVETEEEAVKEIMEAGKAGHLTLNLTEAEAKQIVRELSE